MNTVNIDYKDLQKKLDSILLDSKRQKAIMDSLYEGGKVLKENTKQSLIAKLGSGATSGEHYKKPMTAGIKVTKDDVVMRVVVSILKDFRLKWFENGTDERYRTYDRNERDSASGKYKKRTQSYEKKKYNVRGSGGKFKKSESYTSVKDNRQGGYTGKINKLGFFSAARSDEDSIVTTIIDTLKAKIEDILNNKLG